MRLDCRRNLEMTTKLRSSGNVWCQSQKENVDCKFAF